MFEKRPSKTRSPLFRWTLSLLLLLPVAASADVAGLDLGQWDSLLRSAVDDGQVDYRQWQDKPAFDELVSQVASADLTALSKPERLAFLINAYNILAAQGILSGQSPSTLLGRYTYFKRTEYTVAGQSINLYDLEHDLIRPLGEPRIHFAIVCASHSCPKLRSEAYWPKRLEAQLDSAATDFINDSTRNTFDSGAREAELSKIFKWFDEDFTENGTLQEYLAPFVTDAATANLLRENAFDIGYQKYRWSLNGTL